MLARLLLLFIVVPLVELYLLLRVADSVGVGTTILLVIGTGVLGSILARREGSAAWRGIREALASGRPPMGEIRDGALIVFAAALLLTPGILTDLIGFSLLFPPTRRWWVASVGGRMRAGGGWSYTVVDGRTGRRYSGGGSDTASEVGQVSGRKGDPMTIDAPAARPR